MASVIVSKIIVFVVCSSVAYTMLCFHTWLETGRWGTYLNNPDHCKNRPKEPEIKYSLPKQTKPFPLYVKNGAGKELKEKPPSKQEKQKKQEKPEKPVVLPLVELLSDSNAVTVLGIIIFLVILVVNAVLDTIQAAEDEKENENKNATGEQKQSLSEFANKKTLRRESTKFSLNLSQISESVTGSEEAEEKVSRRKTYTRGDSAHSYLSDTKAKPSELSTPTSLNETAAVGARSVPMVRRSSFPTLPKNPEVQALKLGHRQPSNDSDDESDGKGRRVRIIRRF